MKSPSFMRNGRFQPPKCRGQGSKDWRGNSRGAFLKIPYSFCPLSWVDIEKYDLATNIVIKLHFNNTYQDTRQ
jgi:hypothetical protein